MSKSKRKKRNIMPITSQTFRAVLNQIGGTDAPIVKVFINEFSEMPTIVYASAGKYFLTFANPTLPGDQTYIIFPPNQFGGYMTANRVDVNRVMIQTGSTVAEDGWLFEAAIEVTVYSGWI